MAKKRIPTDPLTELLSNAKAETLRELVAELAARRPDTRRECFDYLRKHVSLTAEQKTKSEGEIVLTLWWELLPDLQELDEYGGGDQEKEDRVADLLSEIREKLTSGEIGQDVREELLDEVLPLIRSGNAGMDDVLYDVAYASCYSDDDWRYLAKSFEAINQDWPIDHARGIYRKLGDREKYLELRFKKMVYGGDYHDLATFYWDQGDQQQALAVAEEGLTKGQGRMDELREFLTERALAGGNRKRYLELQLAQATDGLTLVKYNTFRQICTPEEWKAFEPKIIESLASAWASEQLKIRMERQEYTQAMTVLLKGNYPRDAWDSAYKLQAAEQLESRFPQEILKYYLSGLGNLNVNATRKEYTQKAMVMAKVRHMYLDILKDEERWRTLARKVKRDNLRRPAFQEEFAKVVQGWREL